MNFTIVYKNSAAKELLALPEAYALKVRAAINALPDSPRPHGSKKLKGNDNDIAFVLEFIVLFIP